MKDIVVRWILVLLFIAVSILLIRLFLWLLPILFVLFIVYCIYDYFKNKGVKDVKVERDYKSKRNKVKDKKIVIIDEESND